MFNSDRLMLVAINEKQIDKNTMVGRTTMLNKSSLILVLDKLIIFNHSILKSKDSR